MDWDKRKEYYRRLYLIGGSLVQIKQVTPYRFTL